MGAAEMISFLRWYADERVNSLQMDERRSMPPSMVLDLSMAGLLGLQTERRFTGQELSHVDTARVLEQAAAVDANLGIALAVHAVAVSPIRDFCSEEVKNAVLPRLTTGGALAAIAVSEPDLGTNFRAMTSRALRIPGGGYVVEGRKSLISFGSWASHATLFARLVEDSGEERGITGFLVPTSNPGWRPESEALTFGLRAIPQNEVAIDHLRLPADALVGKEGLGDVVIRSAFGRGRWMLGLVALGAMKRCLQVSVRYASRRTVATGCLLDNGSVQRILSEEVAATRTVEALTTFLSQQLDKGLESPAELCLVCKIISAEQAWKVIDTSVQLMAARGFMDSSSVGRSFRDFRILRIFEGATEGIMVYLGYTIMKAPDKFLARLARYFPALPVVSKFATVLAELTEKAGVESTAQELHRIASTIGDLACWTITTAALTTHLDSDQNELDVHALNWCEQQLQQRINAARSSGWVRERFPSTDLLIDHIAAYAETIGDTEQTYAGDDRRLDPLLRRDDRRTA